LPTRTFFSSKAFTLYRRLPTALSQAVAKYRHFPNRFVCNDLRHTAATLAVAAGVSVKVISDQLGHASISFTLERYYHVLPSIQDEAAARVERMLMGSLSGAPTQVLGVPSAARLQPSRMPCSRSLMMRSVSLV
jgi:hypothetical protein